MNFVSSKQQKINTSEKAKTNEANPIFRADASVFEEKVTSFRIFQLHHSNLSFFFILNAL